MAGLWGLVACGAAPDGAQVGAAAARVAADEFTVFSTPATESDGGDSGEPAPTTERDAIPQGLVGVERFDASGTRKVFVRRPPGALFTELVVAELVGGSWAEEVRVTGTASPDRPAIHPDGQTIAFVSGVSGIASVWTMPFAGGENPTQRTNVGIEGSKHAPGAPPEGFVPPPVAHDGLVFSGDRLTWEGPSGPVSVPWR